MAEYTYQCQHCSDAVPSKRRCSGAVNCGPCAQLKNDAYKAKRYGELLSGFESAARQGLTGAALRDYALTASVGGQVQARADRARQEAAREVAKIERERTNATLRAHGYRWLKDQVLWDGEEPSGEYVWILIAPDGVTGVSVATALAQIETDSVPTVEQYQATQAARAERIEDLVTAGFVFSLSDAEAALGDRTADRVREEAAIRAGYHWIGFRTDRWLAEQGKTIITHADPVVLITGDRAKLLHQDDLPALQAAYRITDQAEQDRYMAWQVRRDTERARDESDRAAGWDGISVRPHERAALDSIFGGMQ